MTQTTADDLNILAGFLARRDIAKLDEPAIERATGRKRVDFAVLLGNSLPYTAEVAAGVMEKGLAGGLVISGGIGHSTEYLREAVRSRPNQGSIAMAGRSEAEIMLDLVRALHPVDPTNVVLETESTNCGSNAVDTRRVLESAGARPSTVLLIQDPTMQMRAHASFLKAFEGTGIHFVSFAPFVPRIEFKEDKLILANGEFSAGWTFDRFVSLVLGEIPRLRDDEHGYGPRGRGFIVHVDIPAEVEAAHARLTKVFPEMAGRLSCREVGRVKGLDPNHFKTYFRPAGGSGPDLPFRCAGFYPDLSKNRSATIRLIRGIRVPAIPTIVLGRHLSPFFSRLTSPPSNLTAISNDPFYY